MLAQEEEDSPLLPPPSPPRPSAASPLRSCCRKDAADSLRLPFLWPRRLEPERRETRLFRRDKRRTEPELSGVLWPPAPHRAQVSLRRPLCRLTFSISKGPTEHVQSALVPQGFAHCQPPPKLCTGSEAATANRSLPVSLLPLP